MLFEETLPAGTKSLFHLHHDSDEVAWVLAGEITFQIGDEVTVGGPRHLRVHAARRPACLEEHQQRNRPARCFLYTPAAAGGPCLRIFRSAAPSDADEHDKLFQRHRWGSRRPKTRFEGGGPAHVEGR